MLKVRCAVKSEPFTSHTFTLDPSNIKHEASIQTVTENMLLHPKYQIRAYKIKSFHGPKSWVANLFNVVR